MAEDTKKISFSFKQVLSKPKVVPLAPKTVPEKAVQFIECVEEKSIKVVGLEVKSNVHELIIPMQPCAKRQLPSEPVKQTLNGSGSKPLENEVQTLDEMAVQAILSDCNKTIEDTEEDTKTIEVPMIINPEGKEMSTAEDYENVPISKFGLAMLRGMGWEAAKGVGKNPKVITASDISNIRPKGMGLGADTLIKSIKKKQQNSEEELKLKDGSYVQFVLGRLDGQYGQVKGFDEGAARVMVKIARTGQMEKVSENTFCLVTKIDYDKNSMVINLRENKKYHESKSKSDDSEDQTYRHRKKSKQDSHISHSDHHSRHKTKKSKHSKSPHRKHKSDHNRHKKYKRKRSSS